VSDGKTEKAGRRMLNVEGDVMGGKGREGEGLIETHQLTFILFPTDVHNPSVSQHHFDLHDVIHR
jgi:hypothetical protein